MKKINLLILIFCTSITLFACKEKQNEITLIITNRSSGNIDSINVGFFVVKEIIAPNKTKTITVDVSKVELRTKGGFNMWIYLQAKKYYMGWGNNFYGVYEHPIQKIFVFENGVSWKDEPLQKPTTFNLFLVNKTGKAIDTFICANNSLQKVYYAKLSTHLVLNYIEFEKNPLVTIVQQGVSQKLFIRHDWSNWNQFQELFYIFPNGKLIEESEAIKQDGKTENTQNN